MKHARKNMFFSISGPNGSEGKKKGIGAKKNKKKTNKMSTSGDEAGCTERGVGECETVGGREKGMGIEDADCARMLQTTIVLFTGNSRKICRRSITKIDVDVEHSLLAFPGGSCTELTWSS